jgi:riboflavin synthase
MFTGIIEAVGKVEHITREGTTKQIAVSSPLSHALKVDQSVAHNGVCLTVTGVEGNTHNLDVVRESLERSSLDELQQGDLLNMERSVRADQRLDGHIVQGHVDATGICEQIEDVDGSWMFTFSYPAKYKSLLIDKGSIAIDGVSLTLIEPNDHTFRVTIIPYTYENTNFRQRKPGDKVNLEFDVLAKFFARHMEVYSGRDQ